MKALINSALRSRGFILGLHAALWLLVYLSALGLGGETPPFQDARITSSQAQDLVPVAQLPQLFEPGIWPSLKAGTNDLDPFYTRHFIPPPSSPPPPPTTRKIELTYQGFYEADKGPKHVIVKLGDAYLVSPIGKNLTANLFAADATVQTLTLTNSAAQTNLLELNAKKEIDVPIK